MAPALGAAPSPIGDAGISAAAQGNTLEVPALAPRLRAPEWIEDGEDAGPTQNCVTQGFEELGRAWTGYFGDIGVSPQKNNVYYVKAGWGVSGNPCGGGAGVHAELVLPAYTQPAISNQNRVRCFYKSPNRSNLEEFNQDCPQNPGQGFYGGYSFDPPGNQGPWPTARGAIFEILVPVKTTQPLNGIESADGSPCYTCLYAGIWMIDGNNSPWVWPRQGVQVLGSGSTSSPIVTYPGPPVEAVFYDPSFQHIQAQFNGNVFNSAPSGEAFFQFGDRAGNYDFEGPHDAIPGAGDWLVTRDFGLPAGETVHWRFCYKPTGGSQTCGADQVYAAPPQTGIQEIEVKKKTATAYFGSPTVTNMTTTFECKLDKGGYKACSSEQKFKKLKKGNHTLSIRAVDQDGHKDATPAKQSFKV